MKTKSLIVSLIAVLLVGTLFVSFRLVRAADPETINIGIIGPVGLPHWGTATSPAGMMNAAILAAEQINSTGGIDIGGVPHYIHLEFGDEHATDLDIAAAYNEMVRLIYGGVGTEPCDFIIGGFRTEVTAALIGASVDSYSEEPHLFFIDGAATNELVNGTYPQLYRIMPVNGTMLLYALAGSIGGYMLNPSIAGSVPGAGFMWNIFKNMSIISGGKPQVSVGVIMEDLTWTNTMYTYLTNPAIYPGLLGPLANVTYKTRIDPTSSPSWNVIWDGVKHAGCSIVIHVFSAPIGVPLVTSWRANNVPALLVGINVMAQLQTHWQPTTAGACEYEAMLNTAGTRTPLTDLTRPFWDAFVARWGVWPIYTAFGAYNGIMALKEAFETCNTHDVETIRAYLSTPGYQILGLTGISAYTPQRDVFSTEAGPVWTKGYPRSQVTQWLDGQMDVVCPRLKSYSKTWALPPWMYPLVWDTNYDKYCGVDDIVFSAEHFGAAPYPAPGYDRWDHVADVNFDDYTGIDDIVAVAEHFGATPP